MKCTITAEQATQQAYEACRAMAVADGNRYFPGCRYVPARWPNEDFSIYPEEWPVYDRETGEVVRTFHHAEWWGLTPCKGGYDHVNELSQQLGKSSRGFSVAWEFCDALNAGGNGEDVLDFHRKEMARHEGSLEKAMQQLRDEGLAL